MPECSSLHVLCCPCRLSRTSDDAGSLDVIQPWKFFLEVRIALCRNQRLIRLLRVTGVDPPDNLHSAPNAPNRSESHRVKFGIVAQIDEKMRRSAIRLPGCGKR